MEAILYIGHGSRSESSNTHFRNFIHGCMEYIDVPIQETAFLELASPSIEEAVESAVRRGAVKITALPVLLSAGIHAEVDIPEAISAVGKNYPDIEFIMGKHIGVDDLIIEILADRLNEKGFGQPEDAVLLVSHGSRNKRAAEEFGVLSEELKNILGSESVYPCFQKENKPSFDTELERVAMLPFKRVFIIPYLLFAGKLLEIMEERASRISAGKKIIFCDPVGFDKRLVEILARRFQQARGE